MGTGWGLGRGRWKGCQYRVSAHSSRCGGSVCRRPGPSLGYKITAPQDDLQVSQRRLNLSKVVSAWKWQSRDWNPGLACSLRPLVSSGLLKPLATRSPKQQCSCSELLSAPGNKEMGCVGLYSQLPARGRPQYK